MLLEPVTRDQPIAPTLAYLVLDPAVERLESIVSGYTLLAHAHFETALAVPPGTGLIDVLDTIGRGPVDLAQFRSAYSDPEIVDGMVETLCAAGFAHRIAADTLTTEELAAARARVAGWRRDHLRRALTIDLDAQPDPLGHATHWDGSVACVLSCNRLADHADTLAALVEAKTTGRFNPFRSEVHARDVAGCERIAPLLRDLHAAVVVRDLPWSVPLQPIAGLSDLTALGLSSHAHMVPDFSILDPEVCARVADWVRTSHLSGLRLDIDPDALWPEGDVSDGSIADLLDAIDALEEAVGDLIVETLPSDAAIVGLAHAEPAEHSALCARLRQAYLRRRIVYLKENEGDNSWSQTPEVEDKLVRESDDLLPNNPGLLGLRPGNLLVDVCGGLGRVARRLSPAVGPKGMVVSIEMLRCLSDRARQFAHERGFTNVDFRPGLAQRLPFADGTADAAVNEWTGAIWELGLGPAMVGEMARVVRPGGRIAVTHRLVRLPLARLNAPWIQYDEIYAWVRNAFDRADLRIVTERVWGQIAPSMIGERATLWRKQYVPNVIDPYDFTYEQEADAGAHADVYLTIIAEVTGTAAAQKTRSDRV